MSSFVPIPDPYAAIQESMQQSGQMQNVYTQLMPPGGMMVTPPSFLPSMSSDHSSSSLPSTSSPSVGTPSSLPSPSSFAGPSTSTAGGGGGTLKRRRFSGAKIQPTRVKKVMQSDEEIGRMVASVPVAIGRAMEHFAEKFLLASAAAVANSGTRTLGPQHMKLAMLANPHFAFLEPILRDVPLPTRAGEVYQPLQQALPPQMQQQQMGMPQQMQYMQQMGSSSSVMDGSHLGMMQSMVGGGDDMKMEGGQPSSSTMMMMQQQQQYYQNPSDQQQYMDPMCAMGQMLMGGGGGTMNSQQGPPPPAPAPLVASPLSSPTSTTAPAAPGPRTARRSSSAVSANGEGEVAEKRPRGRPRKVKKDKCVEDNLVVDSTMSQSGLIAPPSPTDIKTESNEADRMLMPPPPMLPMRPPP